MAEMHAKGYVHQTHATSIQTPTYIEQGGSAPQSASSSSVFSSYKTQNNARTYTLQCNTWPNDSNFILFLILSTLHDNDNTYVWELMSYFFVFYPIHKLGMCRALSLDAPSIINVNQSSNEGFRC